jgi:hypothetical protein
MDLRGYLKYVAPSRQAAAATPHQQSIQITTHFHFDTVSLKALSIASKN